MDDENNKLGQPEDANEHTNNQPENTPANDVPPKDPPEQAPKSVLTTKRRISGKKKKIIVVSLLSVAVLILLAAAIWLFWLKDSNSSKSTPKSDSNKNVSQVDDLKLSPELERFINPTTGEIWNDTIKELPKQNFYSDPDEGERVLTSPTTGEEFTEKYPEITYYELGRRADNTIILAYIDVLAGGFELFEKSNNGEVRAIARPTHDMPEYYRTPSADRYSPNISVDEETHYDSLSLPAAVTLDDGTILQRPDYVDFGSLIGTRSSDADAKVTKAQTIGASTIYRSERSYTDTKLTSIGYYIQTPAHTEYDLTYQPLSLTNNSLTWLGAPKTESDEQEYIKPIARGCGTGDTVTRSDSLTLADLKLLKTSSDGRKVYTIKDPNNPLWVKAYDEFKEFVKLTPENKYASITKEEFIAENAILVFQSEKQELLVYSRIELSPMISCGKPVVYLYPTSTTKVNIKVGADVKISEPLYSAATGWNAIAQPSGQLTVGGKPYDSLFWEGDGNGHYPAITSGTVVKKSEAISTIRTQMALQGFNQKEINDFVEYWHDKLPNKPYIRLSWLTTAQMNQLAPLKISPQPDTVIRTFLDFSGHDAKINIPPQTFTKPERRGFTVTEWGGLLPISLD